MASTASPVIAVDNFTKRFGKKTAVKDLSFSVGRGEIFAFLGANGSGKTTTIRALLGIHEPTEGELLFNGQRFDWTQAPELGYLPEERGLYLDSKAKEALVYFARLKGVDKQEAERRAQEYLDRVELSDYGNTLIKKLSSGQQQKIQVGIATLHQPNVLILDEPTKGLDPLNRSLLVDRLKELHDSGSTILFTTHQLEEIDRIGADTVLIIKEGEKAASDTPKSLKQQYNVDTLDDVFMKVYQS